MKEINGNRDVFEKMSIQLDEKPTIEESQLSRKCRYLQRAIIPKPTKSKEIAKKRKKKQIQEDSSDDEMPPEKPKNRRKNPPNSSGIITVIDLVSDSDESRAPSPQSFIDLTMPSDEEEEIQNPIVMETQKEPEISPNPYHRYNPYGRLPKWYATRKMEREETLKRYAEKREKRQKLEQEAKEKEEKEERLEKRRFLERLRYHKKKDEERIQKAKNSGENSEDVKVKKKKTERKLVEEDGKEKKKRVKKTGPLITDPSLPPSTISLDTPELVPWAPSSKSKKIVEAPPTSIEKSTTSLGMDSESPLTMEITEERIIRDLEELEEIQVVEDEVVEIPPPMDNSINSLLDIEEPLFFQETLGEFLSIPDSEIELIQGGGVLTDAFLSYLDYDKISDDELEQYF